MSFYVVTNEAMFPAVQTNYSGQITGTAGQRYALTTVGTDYIQVISSIILNCVNNVNAQLSLQFDTTEIIRLWHVYQRTYMLDFSPAGLSAQYAGVDLYLEIFSANADVDWGVNRYLKPA